MSVKIYTIARPQFEQAYQDFLLDFLPEGETTWHQSKDATSAERLVEFAGRICYMSFGPRQSPATNAAYIRKLIQNQHDSVLEHAVWTVLLSGVSRAFTHQLVRHRIGFSYSQLSQQYHDESNITFVPPAGLEEFPALAQIWNNSVAESQIAYRRIIAGLNSPTAKALPANKRERIRATRSLARSVLPNASETVIVTTFNARSLRHFLKTRGNTVGDYEMRSVSAALLNAIRPDGPAFFFDFAIEHSEDGLPLVIHNPAA
jgi:thymidylate synthase (FAD)